MAGRVRNNSFVFFCFFLSSFFRCFVRLWPATGQTIKQLLGARKFSALFDRFKFLLLFFQHL